MQLALYQPDIPQNVGALMRLGACLGVRLHVIEPCGFVFDDRRLRRVGMDYIGMCELHRHASWEAFLAAKGASRLLLLTTRAALPYTRFSFLPDDILLLGRESAGVPENVHDTADARLTIPMRPGARALNVAVSAAMVLGEALRQRGLTANGE